LRFIVRFSRRFFSGHWGSRGFASGGDNAFPASALAQWRLTTATRQGSSPPRCNILTWTFLAGRYLTLAARDKCLDRGIIYATL